MRILAHVGDSIYASLAKDCAFFRVNADIMVTQVAAKVVRSTAADRARTNF